MAVSKKASFELAFAGIALVALVVVILFNAILGGFSLGRFDFTEDKLFTVSPATKRILGELQVPMKVKYYVTGRDKMPTLLRTLEQDVVDKLSELSVASSGKLQFSVVDPTKDAETAEELRNKGIVPFQVQTIAQDEFEVKPVYSALTVAYLDNDEEIIPRVVPDNLTTLEYEICKLVNKAIRESDPVVAIYASKTSIDPQMMQMYMQMGQQPPAPQDVYTQVGQLLSGEGYSVRPTEITDSSPIPEDASTLLVLAPKNLDERQRYEINKFIQGGGNALFAVQRYEYNYNPGRFGGYDISATQVETGIDDLLEQYGVPVSQDLLMDQNMQVLSIPRTQNVGGLRLQVQDPVKVPVQIMVGAGQFNEDVALTNHLTELLYLWGSRVEPNDEILAGLDVTQLFTTSGDAWEAGYTSGTINASAFNPTPESVVGKAPLAVLVQGDLPNPYTEGTVPEWSTPSAQTDSVPAAPEPVATFEPVESKILVVGGGKMFDDNVLGAGDNARLLLNSVDALTLGNDLIEIRSKVATARVLRPTSYQKKLVLRTMAVGLVPVLVAAFGVARSVRRRREAASYQIAYQAAAN